MINHENNSTPGFRKTANDFIRGTVNTSGSPIEEYWSRRGDEMLAERESRSMLAMLEGYGLIPTIIAKKYVPIADMVEVSPVPQRVTVADMKAELAQTIKEYKQIRGCLAPEELPDANDDIARVQAELDTLRLLDN